MENALEIKGLCKQYTGFALDNVSFSLPRGAVMGFIGENGAGKTTTIKAVLNLIRRDAGEIRVLGLDNIRDERAVKERIGVVLACIVAAIGGIIYLVHHGAEPMPDYTQFHIDKEAAHTSLEGIFSGLAAGSASEWIQLGVVLLILTPIVRILLSLFDFARERDWLYVGITALVFLVILLNSIGGE